MFQEGKFQSSLKNSHRGENFGFRCRAMPIINYRYNIDAYSTMLGDMLLLQRIELRCLKIGNLKEKNIFQRCQFRNFDGGTVTENQGHENFVLTEFLVRALFIQSTLQVAQTIIYLT